MLPPRPYAQRICDCCGMPPYGSHQKPGDEPSCNALTPPSTLANPELLADKRLLAPDPALGYRSRKYLRKKWPSASASTAFSWRLAGARSA